MLSIQNFSEMFRRRCQKRSKHSSTPHIWFSNWNIISKCWMSSRVDLKMDILWSLCSPMKLFKHGPLALGLMLVAPEFMLCSFSSYKSWQKVERAQVCPELPPKYGRPTERIASIHFLTCFINLSIGGFWLVLVGCGCRSGSTNNISICQQPRVFVKQYRTTTGSR